MSKITTVYDDFITLIESSLPEHKRLSDPYLLVKNTDAAKRKGYGLKYGAGELQPANSMSCDILLRRDFIVVLSRLVYGRESEPSRKAETEKALMEDLFTLVSSIESDPTMGSTAVLASGYINDNGIEFLSIDSDNVMMIQAIFNVRYREDLN